jgi:hypothetical protein
MRLSRTSGVPPMASRIESLMSAVVEAWAGVGATMGTA